MLISGFVFVGSMLGFYFLSGYVLPDLLACLAGIFIANTYWCLRLQYWDELGKGRLREKVFVICWEWGQRIKGDHTRFSVIELVMRLRVGEL